MVSTGGVPARWSRAPWVPESAAPSSFTTHTLSEEGRPGPAGLPGGAWTAARIAPHPREAKPRAAPSPPPPPRFVSAAPGHSQLLVCPWGVLKMTRQNLTLGSKMNVRTQAHSPGPRVEGPCSPARLVQTHPNLPLRCLKIIHSFIRSRNVSSTCHAGALLPSNHSRNYVSIARIHRDEAAH